MSTVYGVDEHGNLLKASYAVQAAPGQVYFDWDASKGVLAPFTGAQFANTGTVSVNQRWRGNLLWTTQGGRLCADFQNTVPPPATPPWTLCAGTFAYTGAASKIASYPFDRAHGIAFYVPAGFAPPGPVTVFEPFFNNVGGQGPFKIIVTKTGQVVCDFLGGLWTSTGGYQYNAQNGKAPQKTVAYALKQGAWNYIAWTCHYALDTSGAGQFYYKAAGDPSWSLGDAFGGFPTATWSNTTGAPAPPLQCSHLLNNYEFSSGMTQDFDMYYARLIIADLLSDVQAALP